MARTNAGRPRTRRGPRGKLAESLRQARSTLGWTQAEAATALGTTQPTWARWESGSAKPRGVALRLLADWAERMVREGGSDAA